MSELFEIYIVASIYGIGIGAVPLIIGLTISGILKIFKQSNK